MRAVMAKHLSDPFEWGGSDCSFVFDVIEAVTGFDAIADMRGYLTEAGALRAIRRAGFETVQEIVEASFCEIPPGLAIRGDIGYPAVVAHPLMSPALIDGSNAFSKQPHRGVIVIERAFIARAWAV